MLEYKVMLIFYTFYTLGGLFWGSRLLNSFSSVKQQSFCTEPNYELIVQLRL